MSASELPTIAPRDAVCYIDFEFVLQYHESLTQVTLLQKCISAATNDVLKATGRQGLSLSPSEIQIPELDWTNKRIKVSGYIVCKEQQRPVIMESLRLAQKGKKISKQIIEATGIKRAGKAALQQFDVKFSNEHMVDDSFVSRTQKSYEHYQRTKSMQSNASETEEKKQNDEKTNDDNTNADPNDHNTDPNDHNTDEEEDDEEQPPLTHLLDLGASSVVIHEDVIDNKADDEDEYDVISKPSTQSTQDNDSSFQMVDDPNDGDDQSSNEEQKAAVKEKLGIDLDTYTNMSGADTPSALSGDDFSTITPIVPGVSTLGIGADKNTNAREEEVTKLRLELVSIKQQHAEELDHFKNKIMTLKNQNTIQRKKSRISMKIDDAIMKKQLKQQTDDKVMELESELLISREDNSLELQRVQLRHQTELKNFEIQLRQTQQHHVLELQNVRKTHQIQTQQLQAQIRALTGSLERESEKDRKIYDLSEELEQLKVDMERTIQNYDHVIDKLNAESEENIRREIDKRIKETAQFKRDINDLQQTLKREITKKNRLEGEIRQLQDENQSKDSVIAKMKNLFVSEKKKAASLERKLLKSKRNVHYNSNAQSKEEKQTERNSEMLSRGKHLRKKSNKFQNRTVTMRQLETGDAVIEIEKMDDSMDTLADVMEFASNYDPDVDTDSDYEINAEDRVERGHHVATQDGGNEEIALKEQQIAALREKVTNLNEKIDALKEEKAEEVQLLQQKIGSLQQKMEIEDENFMKQNQMLEFKLNQKENYAQKLQDDLRQARKDHRKEIRDQAKEIEKCKGDLIEKEREIRTLGENLDLMEEENARLKDVEEDYVAEMEELDVMLDEMRQQNEDTNKQLEEVELQRDEDTKTWQNKVHVQSKSIAELQSLLNGMKIKEIEMMTKDAQMKELIDTEESKETVQVEVIEEDTPDAIAEDIQWKGQMQAEPQQEMMEETPQSPPINKEDYIEKEEMERRIEAVKRQHTTQMEGIQSKHAQECQHLETRLKHEIETVNNDKDALRNELNESTAKIEQFETQLEVAEKSRISLLQSFMREMDRMRDEIRRLNASRRSET